MTRFNLRSKIFLSISLVVSFLFIVAFFFLNFSIKKTLIQKIYADLSEAKVVFDNFFNNRFDTLLLNARVVADSPHLKSVVSISGVDHETVSFTLKEIHEIIKSDLLTVVDSRGIVLSRVDEPSRYGDNISHEEAIKIALEGVESRWFLVKDKRIYCVVAVPIIVNNVVEGVLKAGFLINQETIKLVRDMNGCENSFISIRRNHGFNLICEEKDRKDFNYLLTNYSKLFNEVLSSMQFKGPLLLDLGLDKHLVLICPVVERTQGGDVLYAIQFSLSKAMGVYYNNIRFSIFFIGGLIFLGLFIVSYFLSRNISNPIMALSVMAGRIAKGDFSVSLGIQREDEIGTLGTVVNQMAHDLKDRQAAIEKANMELGEWNRMLEKRVEEKTSQIVELNARLLQANKMAAVGQLAGGIAHEINNPLTGVLNNVQLIKLEIDVNEKFSVKDFKDILEVIEESGLRCKRIVNSLLEFSHFSERGQGRVYLNALIEKAVDFAKKEIKLPDVVTIHTELGLDLPVITGYPRLLQEVITHLISNAVWAIETKSGIKEGRVTIKTDYACQDKSIRIFISDTGIGIPDENINRIFEPFFTTKDVGQGTGLGLFMIYTIIQLHKGQIAVESQQGVGTTFKIILPVI